MLRSVALRLTTWLMVSTLTLVVIAIIGIEPAQAGAALPGSLDSDFSGDGSLTAPDGTRFADVAMRGDRPVVCGSEGAAGLIERYKANGDPDPTFSTDGKVVFDPAVLVVLNRCIVLNDGRVVVIGGYADAMRRGGGPTIGLIGVFKADGRPDRTFSDDGWRPIAMDGKITTSLSGVSVHPGGKLVVVGNARTASEQGFFAARVRLDGSIDKTFSKDGRWYRNIEPSEEDGVCVLVRSDGAIVLLGYTRPPVPNNYLLTVVTLRSNGTLDPDSAGDGIFETDVDPEHGDVIADAKVRPDDRIVAVVTTNAIINGHQRSNVTRLTLAGKIDRSFGGGDGFEPINGAAMGLAMGGGTIVTLSSPAEDQHFLFTRFLADGTLDASFGTAGVSDPGLVLSEPPAGIELDSQGRIVAAGTPLLMRLVP